MNGSRKALYIRNLKKIKENHKIFLRKGDIKNGRDIRLPSRNFYQMLKN